MTPFRAPPVPRERAPAWWHPSEYRHAAGLPRLLRGAGGEGIGFDRNGQLLIFKTHADAMERRKTVRWEADIMPIDLVRAR